MSTGGRYYRKVTEDLKTKILGLNSQGLSPESIAPRVGVGSNAVRRCLRETKSPGVSKLKKRFYNRDKVFTSVDGVHRGYRVPGRRLRPTSCELCKQDSKRVEWHHWDDNHLEHGMWLCLKCHTGAEFIEHGMDRLYLELKGHCEKV